MYVVISFKMIRYVINIINSTSNRVFTTVMGISRAPDMDRAVMPKEMACRAVICSSRPKACFSQCNDEKYRPTPGITLVIDYEFNIRRPLLYDHSNRYYYYYKSTKQYIISYRRHAFPESKDILFLHNVRHRAYHSISRWSARDIPKINW